MNDLKYLFIAELKDGSIYKQNKEDASIKFRPVKDSEGNLQGKSAMADIQEDIDNFNIKKFYLVQQGLLSRHIISVDLISGNFEIDGVEFHPQNTKPVIFQEKLKLIYWRDRRIHKVTPAAYYLPKNIIRTKDGGAVVVNSAGEKHLYQKVSKIWEQEDNIGTEEAPKLITRTYILPMSPLPETEYVLGWQTTINGKNYQQKIVVK